MVQEYFSQIREIAQIEEEGSNFWGNQFYRKSELFGPPFCISILKVLRSQIFRHSLDFNAFWLIQEGPNFMEEPIMQKVWITWSHLLYLNFKRFMDPNSASSPL